MSTAELLMPSSSRILIWLTGKEVGRLRYEYLRDFNGLTGSTAGSITASACWRSSLGQALLTSAPSLAFGTEAGTLQAQDLV